MKKSLKRVLPTILSPVSLSDTPETYSAVQYDSQGCLLIMGDSNQVIDVAEQLKDCLHVVVLVRNSAVPDALPEDLHCLQGELSGLSGYLGHFEVNIKGKQGNLNLGLLCPENKGCFDLILDLSNPGYLQMEVLPLGYYAPGDNPNALQRALTELPHLIGSFYKQKFFNYYASKCAHGRNGISGCHRCMDVCPTEAIGSSGNRITINPYLCQGCGTCALVCPSGAVTYRHAPHENLMDYLRSSLREQLDAGHTKPCVLFYHDQLSGTLVDKARCFLPARVIRVALNGFAAVGMEIWLATFAYGAAEIVLLVSENLSTRTLHALRRQLDNTERLLAGMGYPAQCLRLIEFSDERDLKEIFENDYCLPSRGAANFATFNDKRNTFKKALDYLLSLAPAPHISVQLNSDAPVGEVIVDRDACTLCMSCVKVCPSKALKRCGKDASPQLGFVEGLCLQCGICAAACPEDAIGLAPRFVFNPEIRETLRILNESPAFYCIACGKPFSTKAIIDLMSERLKDNPFFQGDGSKKLQMCPECRAQYNIVEQFERLASAQKE